MKRFHLKLSCLLLLTCSSLSVAGSLLHLPLRLTLWGSTGSNSFAEGDFFMPMLGNANQLVYSDKLVKYGDSHHWMLSGGTGIRKVYADAYILGAYFFMDYNKTHAADHFTVLSPGVEFISMQWDAHLNGYQPIGKRRKYVSPVMSVNNHLMAQVENIGPGADVEVGYTLNIHNFNQTRLFAGAYYFHPEHTRDIKGIEVGFELPLGYKQTSIEVRDSYDNVHHNTILLTVRVTFGGFGSSDTSIQDHMLDRIPRNLGNFYNGSGIPSDKKFVRTGGHT